MSRERRGGAEEERDQELRADNQVAWPGKRSATQDFAPRQLREPVRPPLLVDREPLQDGQMLASAFLDELHGQVVAAANAELGALSAAGCPYIDEYFARYRQGGARELEATLARFAPNSRRARTASEMFPVVVARVRAGIQTWRTTQKLPADVEALAPGAAAAVDAAAAAQPTKQASVDALEADLGPGQPLDGATASQMSAALGADVSNARVHTGPAAARRAAEVDAKAFAVGDNVVFGAGAFQPGTLEGDALLAHELAHVAQQSDAARDPAARKRPIGDEAAAAEGNANQAAMSGATGRQTFGDVLKTGLQLQRCPGGEQLPKGPPMSGKEADRLIATVPEISELIQNDIQRGFTGEKMVTMFDDFEKYVDSLAQTPMIMMNPDPKQRREIAREFAKTAKGYTEPSSRKIYIYTQGTPAFVTIHEVMHMHTSDTHLSGSEGLGHQFVEGAADYFTEIVCARNNVPFYKAYPDELLAVKRLKDVIGQEELAYLTFHGRIAGAKAIVDSKGAGTWDAYRKKMKSKDEYQQAYKLLTGAKEANVDRLEKEERAQQQAERDDKAKQEAADAKARESWPEEGKQPVKGTRVINKSVVGGKHRFSVSPGGKKGIREGWTAHVTLTDGSTLDVPVVRVRDLDTMFDVDTKIEPNAVKSVELRPRSK